MPKSMEEMMAQRLSEVEPPKNLPIGNYVFNFNRCVTSESKDGAWEFLRVFASVAEPCDDVDPDELEAYGNYNTTSLSKSFISPTDPDDDHGREVTLDQIIRFCSHLGLSDDKKTATQILAEAKGAKFIGQVEHRPRADDPDAPPNVEITRTAPVE